MRANNFSGIVNGVWWAGVLAIATWAPFAAPQSDEQAKIQELQSEVDALNRELVRLKGGDPGSRQQAMQNHWSMMQNHMRSMRQMPGMGPHGCGDWMMMDPNVMGTRTMGMMNCPMMGHGTGASGWAMPSGMTPGIYQQTMQGHMQKMRTQMSAISREADPAKRQVLMRDHYETMYRGMQMMRGMGWMWGPHGDVSLPEADSTGAKLVSKYCGQCHAPPSPSLHTSGEWSEVIQRMRAHIGQQQIGTEGAGVLAPSATELEALSGYLGKHARATP